MCRVSDNRQRFPDSIARQTLAACYKADIPSSIQTDFGYKTVFRQILQPDNQIFCIVQTAFRTYGKCEQVFLFFLGICLHQRNSIFVVQTTAARLT